MSIRELQMRVTAKLLSRFDVYQFIPPYDYVQNIVSRHMASYLGKSPSEIKRIAIVGTYLGNEVPYLARRYRNAEFKLFECSPRYLDRLRARFNGNSRIEIIGRAVSDELGSLNFFETNLRGSGSIMKIGELSQKSYGAEQEEVYLVEATTLDHEFPHENFDCLWIDVQGAELKVLNGAKAVLERTDSIFIEVCRKPNLYENSVLMSELTEALARFGFEHAALGLDRRNHTGNAFYTKL